MNCLSARNTAVDTPDEEQSWGSHLGSDPEEGFENDPETSSDAVYHGDTEQCTAVAAVPRGCAVPGFERRYILRRKVQDIGILMRILVILRGIYT